MNQSFKRIFQATALLSVMTLVSCEENNDYVKPPVGDIARTLSIDKTFTFELGSYTCDNAFVGEVKTNADGTQTFHPLHTGTCMVVTPNHDLARYRITVEGTIDVFPALDLSWGTSYEDMMTELGIPEAEAAKRNEAFGYHALYISGFSEEFKVKKTVTVKDEMTGGDKQEEQDFNVNGYTFYFDSADKLDHVEVLFDMDDLESESASGFENLELYLGQNYLRSTSDENEWFNALNVNDAKTIVNVTEEAPSFPDATLVVFKKAH